MNIQLTSYGVELLQGSIPFKITKYELGSAYNYSPSLDASSLEGELVYSGSPTDPIVINANTIKYSIANGGTGASTKAGAFDALAPTVSKGDLIVNNGTANVALSVGTDGSVLVADSTASTGYTWTNVIRGGTF